jgi:hypothetical protein
VSLRLRRVFRLAPQRIVVADAVGPVADIVARRLVAPRLERVLDRHADQFAQVGETLVSDQRKALLLFRHFCVAPFQGHLTFIFIQPASRKRDRGLPHERGRR